MSLRSRLARSSVLLALVAALGAMAVLSAGPRPAVGDADLTDARPAFKVVGGEGYWFVASDGGIFAFGKDAPFHGSTGNLKLNQPIVGMAPTPFGDGYWLVARDGGIFAFKGAQFFGSTGGTKLNQPIVGMAATPTGKGYWLVASDGGIFAFGDAQFFGSTGNLKLVSPIVGMAAAPDGKGYYLVAADGGMFAFGTAPFFGSAGGGSVRDVVGMSMTGTGRGYWLVTSTGKVFNFGDAKFAGDMANRTLAKPIVGMDGNGFDDGYWLVASDGGIFAFGDAPFYGSTGGTKLNQPIVGMAAAPIYVVDEIPGANPDSATTNEDTPVTVDVLANDTGLADGPVVTVSAAPAKGTATVGADNKVTYTPNANANGTDTFTYKITDEDGDTATATVNVTITAVDDVVATADDTSTVTEDTATALNVLGNDTGTGDGPLTVEIVTAPTNGTATVSEDRTILYTPGEDYSGPDSLTYRVTDADGDTDTADVTITVTEVDDVPVVNDDTLTTAEDTTSEPADVLANDENIGDKPTTVTVTEQGTKGVATVGSGKRITYTPNADANGTDTFTYQVTDADGDSDTAIVTVTITPADDPATVTDDTATTPEDTPATIDVTDNDSAPDGIQTVTITDAVDPAGTAVANDDGTVTYTPPADFAGEDSFSYRITDADGDVSPHATVTVTVTEVDDVPVANDDTLTTVEDTESERLDVLANDTALGDGPVTVTIADEADKGTTVVGTGQRITYTPNPDATGTDTFTYQVTDADGDADTAVVTVTITPADDLVVANDDTATTAEDTPVAIDVLADDDAPDGPVVVTDGDDAENGTLSVGEDNRITYTPNADFNGTDTFTYTATDADGDTDTATVTVTVEPADDMPVANADMATATEDGTAVVVDVLANDTGLGDGGLVVAITQAPTKGDVTVTGTGASSRVRYVPNADANGEDSFTYSVTDGDGDTDEATVTITIGATNDTPTAVDDAATTDEDAAVTIPVLANDTGAVDGPLTVTVSTPPTVGTATVNPDNTVTFTPAANDNGSETFEYTVTDADGESDTALVTVTITAVDDGTPVAADDGATNADRITTTEDTPIDIDILANDTIVDQAVASIVSQPARGTVVLLEDGRARFTPAPDSFAQETFTYKLRDSDGQEDTATVTVRITPVNDTPVAADDTAGTNEDTPVNIPVLANDTGLGDTPLTITTAGLDLGTVTVNPDRSLRYSPNPNASGVDTFTYTVTDADGESATATVQVAITAVDDVPVANNDSASTTEDVTITSIDVLANDSDAEDGKNLVVEIVDDGSRGVATVNPDKTLSYDPNPDATGTDIVTYRVTDTTGKSATANVNIQITAVDDIVDAVNDTVTTTEDTPVTTDVAANDLNTGDTPITATIPAGGAPTNGTVTCAPNSTSCTYTPNADYVGTDSYTYQLRDVDNDTDTATVSLTVTAVDDTPDAFADTATTPEDVAKTINVLANDTDKGDAPLVVTIATAPAAAKGTATVNPDNTITYTPAANVNGPSSFTYKVTDTDGDFSIGTVDVTVTPVNDASPVANTDNVAVAEDGTADFDVVANDGGAVDILRVTAITQAPTEGTAEIVDNTIRYTPDANYFGADTLKYEITDSDGQTAIGTVNITVNGTDDVQPVANDDTAVTEEDTLVTTNVVANDAGFEDGTFLSVVSAQNGSATCLPNGPSCTFTPAADFAGTARYTYRFTDSDGQSDTAVVTVSVTPQDDTPVAANDSTSFAEDPPEPVLINVLANDTKLDHPVTVTTTSTPAKGTVTVDNNVIRYTPNPNANGVDTFTYEVTDADGDVSNEATVTVTITAVDDGWRPNAPNKSYSNVSRSQPTTFDLDAAALNNTTPPSADKEVLKADATVQQKIGTVDGVTYSLVTGTGTGNGTVTCTTQGQEGTCTYTPPAGGVPVTTSTLQFTYRVTDSDGDTDTASVTMTFAPVG